MKESKTINHRDTSGIVKVARILMDYGEHSNFEICEKATGRNPLEDGGGSLFALAARIGNLKEEGWIIPQARQDPKIHNMFWYHTEFIPFNWQLHLGMIQDFPAPEKEAQGVLFDLTYM